MDIYEQEGEEATSFRSPKAVVQWQGVQEDDQAESLWSHHFQWQDLSFCNSQALEHCDMGQTNSEASRTILEAIASWQNIFSDPSGWREVA